MGVARSWATGLSCRFGDGYMITVRTKSSHSVKDVVRFFNRNFPEAVLKVGRGGACVGGRGTTGGRGVWAWSRAWAWRVGVALLSGLRVILWEGLGAGPSGGVVWAGPK